MSTGKTNVPLNDYRIQTAFGFGNIMTKLSVLIFGLGNLVNKQIGKGLAFLAIEIAYIYYMVTFGISALEILLH